MAEKKKPTIHLDDPVKVGERLRAARLKAGLTMRDLAFEGCTPGYISRVERGDRIPSLQVLLELARRLQKDPDYLAWGDVPGVRINVERRGETAGAGGLPVAVRSYEALLRGAKSFREEVWALSGLAQAATEAGDLKVAHWALERATRRVEQRLRGSETAAAWKPPG
jgi:transcriptional regulator with XRE-family HTH domain